MKYFAYGSNMNYRQMDQRCPGNKFLGPAELRGYKFIFDGNSTKRKGAVANIIKSPNNEVWGGLFEISEANFAALDCYEGHPSVYRRMETDVIQEEAKIKDAITYYRIGEGPGSPSKEYKNLILRGARDCGLPDVHIEYIKKL